MREILFRGKRMDNGEWVEGFYVNVPEHYKHEMSGESYIVSINNGLFMEVVLETVGQYTGLKDKNGNKIFEGDIFVSYEYGDKKYDLIGVIERRGASFILTHYKPNGERIVLESDIVQGEVIGNIYDNPELLEVEK